ncbi:hypothetical protein CEF21_19055 [Bacillus sp. FJAT-42376]|uniref:DUF5366 family protein n=1 Tax=Bacillus sp. FJAT-42376 TaxID=2014076 RepID=UPI000F4F9BAE|nr:DUF5366 family protein [Bacillus sp. FJAT-42376]AZB44221.1 hypothetical protein CEF21_19055 [Bacillus sp. FJAT-42376]
MRNTYFTSYFPLISLLLFSTSFSISTVMYVSELLKKVGIYSSMLDFFSESEMKIALFALFALFYFMVFAALKLIANTVTELSFLFFSQDKEGVTLKKIRAGSAFYLAGGAVSLFLVQFSWVIAAVFLLSTLCYFVFTIYQASSMVTSWSLIGMVLFNILFWFVFTLGLFYLFLRLYNGVINSLPI